MHLCKKMDQKVRAMLENMYELFEAKFHDPTKSWDNLIDFLAVDNYSPLHYQLNHNFEWLFGDLKLCEALMKIYDNKKLKSDFYDHLGEMYLENIISKAESKKKGIFHTPKNVADLMAQISIPESDKQLNILDPAVGTGRLLMAAYKKAPNSLFFGVDIDLRSIRIAYKNFAIHSIQAFLLHANSLEHEIDIAIKAGEHNWKYANKWYSHIDKLKPISSTTNSQLKLW